MTDAFFVPLDEGEDGVRFRATDHARGPWDPRSLHAGPPSALLAHCIDRVRPAEDRQASRVTVEIHRPVPLADLTVQVRVLRGGRKVELLGATMTDADAAVIMTASVWRIRTAEVDLGAGIEGRPPPGPDGIAASTRFFRPLDYTGYVQAMEVRFAGGDWADPGPAVAWMRPRVDLVEGRALSPLERVLIAADSGNGVSARFDGLFINTELSVHLTRLPEGEWVCLEAQTILTDHGIGLAHATLHDRLGPIGLGAQSLLLDRPG